MTTPLYEFAEFPQRRRRGPMAKDPAIAAALDHLALMSEGKSVRIELAKLGPEAETVYQKRAVNQAEARGFKLRTCVLDGWLYLQRGSAIKTAARRA